MIKSMDLEPYCWFLIQLFYLQAVWTWSSYSTSLCLNFLTCEMQSCGKNQEK